MLVHSPFLAVAGPVLRELIAVPSFSGLKAISPPQNGSFHKKIGSRVSVPAHIYHSHNSQNCPWRPISMALTAQKKDRSFMTERIKP